MLYELLKFGHLIGLILIGAGLIGVFLSDIRTREAKTLPVFAEAVRNIALFYDGLVVPGALLLLGSGRWLIIEFYDGWAFLIALARGDGAALRVRVRRGQHDHTPLLHEAAPTEH
jgi:Predicted integral membrane protein (DUF2269)